MLQLLVADTIAAFDLVDPTTLVAILFRRGFLLVGLASHRLTSNQSSRVDYPSPTHDKNTECEE